MSMIIKELNSHANKRRQREANTHIRPLLRQRLDTHILQRTTDNLAEARLC
jgi:hypothetical protein